MALRQRKLVAVVLAVAVLAGLLVAFRPGVPPQSREYTVWLATADILVDTSDSQVVDARVTDFATLASRTSLLGNLIATEPLKSAIAEAGGVPADHLVVVPPANTIPATGGAPLPPRPGSTAASLQIPDVEATALTLSTDATLPILRVTAQAPNAATAGGLAAGTVSQLKRYLDSIGAKEQIPDARKLVVRQLTAPIPAPVTRGSAKRAGLAVAILVALLGFASIAVAPTIAHRWKLAGGAEAPPMPTGSEIESIVPIDRAAPREERGDNDMDLALAPKVNHTHPSNGQEPRGHEHPEAERAR